MALGIIADPNGLSQGASTTVTDLAFTASSGRATTITSTALIPVLYDNEWIEIRNAVDTVNNGLYRVDDASITTSSVTLEKVSGSDPTDATDTISTIEVFTHTEDAQTDMVFTATTAPQVQITSIASGLPAMVVGQRFTVADHTTHDGVYQVVVVNTSLDDYTVESLTGATTTAGTEAASTYTDMKNLMWDTAGLGTYLLEDTTTLSVGHLDLDGVLGQAYYSKAVIDWKDDNFLIANAPFPMLTIDADAGKYLIGQDPSGNNSGWVPKDDADVTGTYGLRTRKMYRNMGWSEVGSGGTIDAQYAGVRTLGAFLDETAGTGDLAYYQFGTEVLLDDTVDFAFNGPVNEAVLAFNEVGNPDTFTFVVGAPDDSVTRATGSFITDGFKVGGSMTVRAATTAANDGTYVIKTVAALTMTFEATVFDTFEADPLAQVAVDNRTAITLRLRVRTTSGNTNARTFSQADLASAGETTLSNRLFTFGLSNSQDLDITESDANIDTITPYSTGGPSGTMSIDYGTSTTSRGNGLGGGDGFLVGGPYNFGIIIDGNGGTNTQVYEWTQRQLRRSAVDADVDSSTKIGRELDGLMRFVGPTLEVGSVDGGLSFPINPDGPAFTGVYINNLAAASANDTVYFDDLGIQRSAPLTVSVTLDFNSTLIDDTLAVYTLFFDFTRTRASDDLIVTLVSGPTGTFDSASADLSALDSGAGQYVRVSGFPAGVDEPMNGIYQVLVETSTSQWSVERYDGADIVTTTTGTSFAIDEYPIDSPDAIIVKTDALADVTGSASADFNFSFDYSNNVQGGRTASTDADVQARAIGQSTAQYTQSSVATISTSAITIPVTSQIERNFLNP
jgi:hypothetical protein